ncbi:MAG: PP2C family protein-serine/threonine phosphatase, partial [Puniceicoccales bacterium]
LYDVFELGNDRVALAIADVSGKGVSASLLMAICQTHLRHFARQIDSPAEIMRRLNREMTPEMRQDMFITLIFAVVDMRKDTLTFARAGHELLLLVHGDPDNGHIHGEMVGAEGMAIGMAPSEIFDIAICDRTVPFRQGDTAVFYTDGVTEAADRSGTEYTGERLETLVCSLCGRSAREVNRNIVASVESFASGGVLLDDLTLITARHT